MFCEERTHLRTYDAIGTRDGAASCRTPSSTKLSSHNPMESWHLANEVENNTRYSFLAPVTSGVL